LNTKLKYVSVEGDSYSRGVQVGQATKKQIAHSISVYQQTFEVCDIPWHKAREMASRYHKLVESSYPELISELKGIAQGSGYDIDDLFTLNCRTEILPPDFLVRALAIPDEPSIEKNYANECTSFAFRNAANQPVWLSQNWDWVALQRESLIVVQAKTENGGQYITVTEAGMLAKIGLNHHGLGMCLNILRSLDDGIKIGLPVHFLLRAILDCKTVEHAKSLVSISGQ